MSSPEPLATERLLAQADLPCPACGERVSVVVDVAARCARWCCLACRTVGKSPCTINVENEEALPVGVPSA